MVRFILILWVFSITLKLCWFFLVGLTYLNLGGIDFFIIIIDIDIVGHVVLENKINYNSYLHVKSGIACPRGDNPESSSIGKLWCTRIAVTNQD